MKATFCVLAAYALAVQLLQVVAVDVQLYFGKASLKYFMFGESDILKSFREVLRSANTNDIEATLTKIAEEDYIKSLTPAADPGAIAAVTGVVAGAAAPAHPPFVPTEAQKTAIKKEASDYVEKLHKFAGKHDLFYEQSVIDEGLFYRVTVKHTPKGLLVDVPKAHVASDGAITAERIKAYQEAIKKAEAEQKVRDDAMKPVEFTFFVKSKEVYNDRLAGSSEILFLRDLGNNAAINVDLVYVEAKNEFDETHTGQLKILCPDILKYVHSDTAIKNTVILSNHDNAHKKSNDFEPIDALFEYMFISKRTSAYDLMTKENVLSEYVAFLDAIESFSTYYKSNYRSSLIKKSVSRLDSKFLKVFNSINSHVYASLKAQKSYEPSKVNEYNLKSSAKLVSYNSLNNNSGHEIDTNSLIRTEEKAKSIKYIFNSNDLSTVHYVDIINTKLPISFITIINDPIIKENFIKSYCSSIEGKVVPGKAHAIIPEIFKVDIKNSENTKFATDIPVLYRDGLNGNVFIKTKLIDSELRDELKKQEQTRFCITEKVNDKLKKADAVLDTDTTGFIDFEKKSKEQFKNRAESRKSRYDDKITKINEKLDTAKKMIDEYKKEAETIENVEKLAGEIDALNKEILDRDAEAVKLKEAKDLKLGDKNSASYKYNELLGEMEFLEHNKKYLDDSVVELDKKVKAIVGLIDSKNEEIVDLEKKYSVMKEKVDKYNENTESMKKGLKEKLVELQKSSEKIDHSLVDQITLKLMSIEDSISKEGQILADMSKGKLALTNAKNDLEAQKADFEILLNTEKEEQTKFMETYETKKQKIETDITNLKADPANTVSIKKFDEISFNIRNNQILLNVVKEKVKLLGTLDQLKQSLKDKYKAYIENRQLVKDLNKKLKSKRGFIDNLNNNYFTKVDTDGGIPPHPEEEDKPKEKSEVDYEGKVLAEGNEFYEVEVVIKVDGVEKKVMRKMQRLKNAVPPTPGSTAAKPAAGTPDKSGRKLTPEEEAQKKKHEEAMAEIKIKLDAAEKKHKAAEERVKKMEGKIANKDKELANLKSQADTLQRDFDTKEAQRAKAEKEFNDLKSSIDADNKAKAVQQKIIDDAKNMTDAAAKKAAIDAAQQEIDKIDARLNASIASVRTVQANLDTVTNEKKDLETKLNSANDAFKAKETEVQAYRAKYDKKKTEATDLANEISTLKKSNSDLVAKIAQLTDENKKSNKVPWILGSIAVVAVAIIIIVGVTLVVRNKRTLKRVNTKTVQTADGEYSA